MGMDIVLKTELMYQVSSQGVAWENPELKKMVYAAVDRENLLQLINIIGDLAIANNRLKAQMRPLHQRVEQLEKDIEQMKCAPAQEGNVVNKSNAYRDDLDTEKMWELYQKDRSFSKVGRSMGCDGKTVKRRLCAAGYVK